MADAFFAKPVREDCPLTAWWMSYPGHRGLDYGWLNADPRGTQRVYAAYRGSVVYVYRGYGNNGGWGNRVIIEHAPGVRTTYNHMYDVFVNVGDWVETGAYLGVMGDTGRVTGIHLHWELYIDGERVNPQPYREGLPIPRVNAEEPLTGTQRRVGGGGARARRDATSQSEKVDDGYLDPGTVWAFNEFRRGESVEGNNVWFKGPNSGLYYWSGSFDGGADTTGLREVGAPPVASNQRTVTGDGVYERTGPGTSYAQTGREFAAGEVLDFKAWTNGESVSLNGVTTDVWYQGAYSEKWFSAACFTSQSTDGLPEIKNVTAPTPAPGSTLDLAYKSFPTDSPLAKWVGSPNFNYREPRPAGTKASHVTLHWMSGTLAGTDAQFQKYSNVIAGRGDGSSSTYGVGPDAIHQYVRERDYQQADGNADSNRNGISIEHEMSATSPIDDRTVERSAQLLADISRRHGLGALVWMKNVFPHNHWVATRCPGTLPHERILARANAILSPTPTPDPTPKPDPKPTPKPDDETITVSRKWLESIFSVLKKLLGK